METKKAVSSKSKKNPVQSQVSIWKRTQTAEGWKRRQLKMRKSDKKTAKKS